MRKLINTIVLVIAFVISLNANALTVQCYYGPFVVPGYPNIPNPTLYSWTNWNAAEQWFYGTIRISATATKISTSVSVTENRIYIARLISGTTASLKAAFDGVGIYRFNTLARAYIAEILLNTESDECSGYIS